MHLLFLVAKLFISSHSYCFYHATASIPHPVTGSLTSFLLIGVHRLLAEDHVRLSVSIFVVALMVLLLHDFFVQVFVFDFDFDFPRAFLTGLGFSQRFKTSPSDVTTKSYTRPLLDFLLDFFVFVLLDFFVFIDLAEIGQLQQVGSD